MRKVIFLILLFCIASMHTAYFINKRGKNKKQLSKRTGFDYSKNFDINNINMTTTNFGSFGHDFSSDLQGLEYPKDSGDYALFSGGILAGGYVGDELRMANSTFGYEYVPGNITGYNTETEEVEYANPDDSKWKVLKLNRNDTAEKPDYNAWIEMAEFGAPLDDYGRPKILGDQALWALFHDAYKPGHDDATGGTLPLYSEVQSCFFGYNSSEPLKNVVFIKYTMTNKGISQIKDFYFSLWLDPDLGDPDNDRIGVDSENNLAFVYNHGSDTVYNRRNVSMGIDLLEGLKGANGEIIYLTAFNAYIRGSEPAGAPVTYNLLRGYRHYGEEIINPVTDKATQLVFEGDPLTGNGWIDLYPADKRIILTSGPVTFSPGDEQTFLVAIVFGMHDDYLKAVSAMKYNDYFAEETYRGNFDLPVPPSPPDVTVFAGEREIYLSWDSRAESYYEEGYEFQGYNIYVTRYTDAMNKFDWKLVDTYDKIDGIKNINGIKYIRDSGELIKGVVIEGKDSGIKRWKKVVYDEWQGGGRPLIPEKDYYYAVTAYAYNPLGTPEYIESELTPLKITPKFSLPGYDYSALYTSVSHGVEHTAGDGTGTVHVYLVNPDEAEGGEYKIYFSGSAENNTLNWNLSRNSEDLITGNTNFSGNWNYPVIDGIQVIVEGENFLPVSYSHVETGGNITFGTDIGTMFPSGRIREVFGSGGENSAPFLGRDIEIKFTADIDTSGFGQSGEYTIESGEGSEVNYYTDFYDSESLGAAKITVPFEVWDKEEDYRINCVVFLSDKSRKQWNWQEEDYVVLVHSEYNTDNIYMPADPFATWCLKLTSGSAVPQKGDYIVLTYDNPLNSDDIFSFTLSEPVKDDGNLAKRDFHNKIRVVPNPYYGFSEYEVSHRFKVIKFINLPQEPCTIKILNLFGTVLRTINKTGTGTTVDWNLETKYGNIVASGIYLYHIHSPLYGDTFGKFVIFVEDISNYY